MVVARTSAPDCLACKARTSCFFAAELDGKPLKDFMGRRVANTYRKSQIIFNEGTPAYGLYVVDKGRVRVFQSDQRGHQLTVHVANPGELVGNIALLSGEGYTATAEALETSVLSFLEQDAVLDLLERHRPLMLKMLRTLARYVKRNSQLAGDMAMSSSRQRVVNLLNGLLIQYGTFGGGGDETAVLEIRLTRQELGHLAGLAQETVIRVLTELEKEKKIATKGRTITVVDRAALERESSYRRLFST